MCILFVYILALKNTINVYRDVINKYGRFAVQHDRNEAPASITAAIFGFGGLKL